MRAAGRDDRQADSKAQHARIHAQFGEHSRYGQFLHQRAAIVLCRDAYCVLRGVLWCIVVDSSNGCLLGATIAKFGGGVVCKVRLGHYVEHLQWDTKRAGLTCGATWRDINVLYVDAKPVEHRTSGFLKRFSKVEEFTYDCAIIDTR